MEQAKTHYEVIVVGAGVAGIYQIKRLVDLGIDATVVAIKTLELALSLPIER